MHYSHSEISNHLCVAISVSPEWMVIIPPANYVCGRVYCFHVRPTERKSDCASVTFCFLNILKNH